MWIWTWSPNVKSRNVCLATPYATTSTQNLAMISTKEESAVESGQYDNITFCAKLLFDQQFGVNLKVLSIPLSLGWQIFSICTFDMDSKLFRLTFGFRMNEFATFDLIWFEKLCVCCLLWNICHVFMRFKAQLSDRFNSNIKTNSEIELIKWQFFFVCGFKTSAGGIFISVQASAERTFHAIFCCIVVVVNIFSRLFSISKRNEFVSPVLVTVFSI